jgi:hypothetical protein
MIRIESFYSELEKIAEAKTSPRERSLFMRLKNESPVPIKRIPEAATLGGGYYMPKSEAHGEHIGISDERFDTLAHEIGHAHNHQTIWGKLIQSVPSRLAYRLAPAAGVAAGIALTKGKIWPMLIPAAAVTPLLISEAMATQKGKKVLEDLGAKHEEVEKYKRNLRTSFSTYLDTPLASATLGAFSYLIARATSTPNQTQ